DLNRVDAAVGRNTDGDLIVQAAVPTDLGPIVKTIRVTGDAVELIYRLEWPEIPIGSLRRGDFTLHPHAFDRASLFYRCANGGTSPEEFALHAQQLCPSPNSSLR